MFYLQNTDDHLWYEVSLVGDGADMTITWGGTGLPNPPPYSPVEGDPLISVDEYMTILGMTTLDIPANQWVYAALAVSDAVESHCSTSWRVPVSDPLVLCSDEAYGTETLKSPPNGLRVVVAMIIRTMLGRMGVSSAGGSINLGSGIKSETLRNYSYTLAGSESGIDITDVVSGFSGMLKPYRQLYIGV